MIQYSWCGFKVNSFFLYWKLDEKCFKRVKKEWKKNTNQVFLYSVEKLVCSPPPSTKTPVSTGEMHFHLVLKKIKAIKYFFKISDTYS